MRFSWVNPACKFDKVPGAAGLGIDIPVNDYTRTIFGHPNRFEKYSSGSDRKFEDVAIRFGGVVLMVGTLNITNATSETYTGWLQSMVGTIGEEQREKKINELQLSSETYPWGKFREKTFENKADYDEDTDDYCLGEHFNKRFWEEIGRTEEYDEEYYDEEGVKQIRKVEISRLQKAHSDNFNYMVNKTRFGVGDVVTTGEGCVVSAFLFLNFLLKEIFKRCQFFIDPDNNAFLDELDEYRNLAFYNNYNLLEPVILTETKENWQLDKATGQWLLVSEDEVKSITWEIGSNSNKINYVRMIPGINLGDLVLGLQNMLNIVFQFKDDYRVNVIDRLTILTMEPFDLTKYFMGEWIIGERKNTTLKFITDYDKNDAIISDDFHDITDRRGDFKEAVSTMDELNDLINSHPDFGEIRHVIENDEWYEYKWDVSVKNDGESETAEFDRVGWVKISTGPQPLLYGTGDELEEIKTNIYTPYTHYIELVPVKLQNGAIYPTRHLWNSFTPCLFFYLGDNAIANKNYAITHSLQWDDLLGSGLFARRWEPWAAFWNNRLPVEGDFNLPLNVLYYVINNITSKFKTEQGEFIIEEMEVEFGLHMIGKTHIKGFKLP